MAEHSWIGERLEKYGGGALLEVKLHHVVDIQYENGYSDPPHASNL